MKRWHYILLAAAAVAAGGYVYLHRQSLGLFDGSVSPGESTSSAAPSAGDSSARPAHMDWRAVDRASDGFTVEMPGQATELRAPAYNETGATEPVQMITASPGEQTIFAVTWEDNPPVARVNNHIPDRTLNMARDGMLARTQTTLLSESRVTFGGSPARDVTGRNMGGGILNARLIIAGDRLYTLMALFPSAGARREQDVVRFFNSFTPSRSRGIPSTMPSAPEKE